MKTLLLGLSLMSSNNNKITQALNKAYLKLPPTRQQIELFKTNLSYLLKHINDSEGEEFHKNEISEFLKKTYYSPNHYINTKARYDMVIHNGKDNSSSVGVIVEAKSPGNRSEMPTIENLNAKAIRELILYYLRERITNKNLELKHLIATNLYEWFIFDAHEFEKYFANNKSLIKQFTDFEEGRSSGKDTFFFYNSIAAPCLENLESEIKFTHFDLRNYEPVIRNDKPEDDSRLIPLFKFLSPEHLLKLPFKNDSNSLDKDFYRELLHIIGLEESKQGSKKLISRASENTRNYGSLIESAISILKNEDCISQVPRPSDFGETKEEQVFNIALELVITWINRILFLKLLESQLVRYNQGDKGFKFLRQDLIPDYDTLNQLFFSILAIPEQDRDERLRDKYCRIPYLNSSLFEPTDLEHKTIRISNLDDGNRLPVLKTTVLRDSLGTRILGEKPTLIYLFDFLDAYNFSSEGSNGIQEENKILINASVLGLIFEKINGYKDGSFFTPGFISQYMCHETITRAVVQKFNETKGWNCASLVDVNNKIEDKQEANKIINMLRICDPAVGSGHFLVSALNEIISIKSDLKILMDQTGRVLRDYHFEVINDELIVSDPEGELFEYNSKSQESQRVQESIFHEKQSIIENCLFGVDINPNSVKICRLRLWIELLKHAYYKSSTGNIELETLPNIDINIKCGNSLINRYQLDADLREALKSSKWSVENYREAVMLYRNAETKAQKKEMENLISQIKTNFEIEISRNDKSFLKLNKIKGELLSMTAQQGLFLLDKEQLGKWNKKLQKLTKEQATLELHLAEIKHNKIYREAFEWRFEFPEVLNDLGEFTGFDIILGNPPYIRQEELVSIKSYLQSNFSTFSGTADLYVYFVERGLNLLRENGVFLYILPNKWMLASYGVNLRNWIKQFSIISIVDFGDLPVFEEATTYPCLLEIQKKSPSSNFNTSHINTLAYPGSLSDHIKETQYQVSQSQLPDKRWILVDNRSQLLIQKIQAVGIPLNEFVNGNIFRGVLTGLNEAFVIDETVKTELIKKNPICSEILKPFLLGKDVKRYSQPNNSQWLIFTRRGIDISLYPSILEHLEQFKLRLIPKPKDFKGSQWSGRKEGSYKWYEIQDAVDYYKEFEQNKIIYPNICKKPEFTFDTLNLFTNQKCFFIPNGSKYLLGLLNSKLFFFLYRQVLPKLRGGFFEPSYIYLKDFPIANTNPSIEIDISSIVDQIMSLSHSDGSKLENEIDNLVYKMYDLNTKEIAQIESYL